MGIHDSFRIYFYSAYYRIPHSEKLVGPEEAYQVFHNQLNKVIFSIGFQMEQLLTNFIRDYMRIIKYDQITNLADEKLLLQLYESKQLNYTFYQYWIRRLRLKHSDIFNLYICFKTIKKFIQKRKVTMMSLLHKYMFRDVCGIICQYAKEARYRADEVQTRCYRCRNQQLYRTGTFRTDTYYCRVPSLSIDPKIVIEKPESLPHLRNIDIKRETKRIFLNPETKEVLLDSDKEKCFCLDCDVPEPRFSDNCYRCHEAINWTKPPYCQSLFAKDKVTSVMKLSIENRLVYNMSEKKTILLILPAEAPATGPWL